ncbi:hypothetical protein RHMOL_Rhmol12G0192500 [Rhododendron molle]|uniref:Uncharacterized protein n=1 Tax=Rhododendron molle TaxID=49168 RepID=A0ACC0LK50_RHOML|nr:hypothetical protein RHMOL_Rhmol12G0192500 [Rhododendron molle]
MIVFFPSTNSDLITSMDSVKRRLKDLRELTKRGYNVVQTFEALSVDEVRSFVERLGQTVNSEDIDFIVLFEGPKETLYEGGTWKVRVKFPEDYVQPAVARLCGSHIPPKHIPVGWYMCGLSWLEVGSRI